MVYESRDQELYEALRELAEVEVRAVSVQPPTRPTRPAMAAVEADEHGSDTRVTVRLRLGTREFAGTAKGPSNVPAICRSAAEATLRALEDLTLSGYAVARIDWLDILDPPGTPDQPQIMTVAVVFRTVDREDLLIGTALIRGVEYEAAVRAVLDALNRQVELIIQATSDPDD